jgi:hypothetical protein
MSKWRRLSGLAAVSVFGVALAACGSSNSPSSSSSTTNTSSKVPGIVPTRVPNEVSVRKDAQLLSCGATKGGWSAGGTVKNSLGRDATYQITIFFTSDQATDLAYAKTSVPVSAGQSERWSAPADFAPPAQVLCVLRGVAVS